VARGWIRRSRDFAGSLADIARLATVIESKLAAAQPGSTIRIQEEFAEDSPYGLILEVKEDGFDPASN
jgi:hypothetical protein